MSVPTPAQLLGFLQEHEFLTPGQLQQLGGNVPTRFPNAQALARDLVSRKWLTAYQADVLLQGQGATLLVGPYRIQDRLGAGGVGQVFKAIHTSMERVVALKMIPKDRVSNPVTLGRFNREVRAVAKLSHPNIVTAFEVNQAGETHFLAMEHVDGIDLAKMVQQSGRLPISNACEYIRQAALGLQHAHEKGLVHRDIKPANLMVTQPSADGPPVVKILDFGLARFESETAPTERLTKLGGIVGTVDYIAPEQAGDARTADIRADIYSLGCSLFYLLTGKPPFGGEDAVERISARVMGDVPSVRAIRPEVSPALEGILTRMMARDPAQRYQTPGEVAKALEPHTEKGKQVLSTPAPVVARPKSQPAKRPSVAPSESGFGPLPLPRSGERQRRNPALFLMAVGGVLGFLVLLIGVIVLVAGRGNGESTKGEPVAVKGPGDADKPKDAEPDRKKDKKDKTDTPEKPAPLPRLVAFPKLSLPERGAADLQVKVERQG